MRSLGWHRCACTCMLRDGMAGGNHCMHSEAFTSLGNYEKHAKWSASHLEEEKVGGTVHASQGLGTVGCASGKHSIKSLREYSISSSELSWLLGSCKRWSRKSSIVLAACRSKSTRLYLSAIFHDHRPVARRDQVEEISGRESRRCSGMHDRLIDHLPLKRVRTLSLRSAAVSYQETR